MARLLKKAPQKLGQAPGSFIFVGTKKTESVHIQAYRYNKDKIEIFDNCSASECRSLLSDDTVTWINITGLHDPEVMASLSEAFSLHHLFVEDLMNTNQRPKYNEFDNNHTFIIKMLDLDEKAGLVHEEQISIVIGANYVLSFQEAPGDVFGPIRDRIAKQGARLRQRKSDYLAFLLLDAVVDNYILSIEFFGDAIEKQEAKLLVNLDRNDMHRMSAYKREINSLRRTIRPVLEMLNQFERSESEIIDESTIPFIRDLSDHVVQATEAIEIYKELLNECFQIYNASLSQRMNDVMHVLTVFSVLFIPLTFLAGVYGTNFQYFPELGHPYAYPIFWAVMIGIAVTMLLWFRRKKWL